MPDKRANKADEMISLAEFRRAAFRAGMSPTSPSYQAAQAVLVNGARQIDTTITYGITRQTVCEAVAKVKEVVLGGGVCPMCLRKMEGHKRKQAAA